MPIYEYECGKCEEVFEAILPVSGGLTASCPACGSKGVTKLISAFGISRPGFKLNALSPGEEASAEKKLAQKGRGRCCDNVCDPL